MTIEQAQLKENVKNAYDEKSRAQAIAFDNRQKKDFDELKAAVIKEFDSQKNPKTVDLSECNSIVEVREKILPKYAQYSEMVELEKLKNSIPTYSEEARKKVADFNDWVKKLEGNKNYTEDYKYKLYDEKIKKVKSELSQLSDDEIKGWQRKAELENIIASRTLKELEQAATVNELTPSDYAYIDLMLKRGGDRLELAKKYNYNGNVLDILNAGLLENSYGIDDGKPQYIKHPLKRLFESTVMPYKSSQGEFKGSGKLVNGQFGFNSFQALRHLFNKPMRGGFDNMPNAIIKD